MHAFMEKVRVLPRHRSALTCPLCQLVASRSVVRGGGGCVVPSGLLAGEVLVQAWLAEIEALCQLCDGVPRGVQVVEFDCCAGLRSGLRPAKPPAALRRALPSIVRRRIRPDSNSAKVVDNIANTVRPIGSRGS
jgi:hypothetical protein